MTNRNIFLYIVVFALAATFYYGLVNNNDTKEDYKPKKQARIAKPSTPIYTITSDVKKIFKNVNLHDVTVESKITGGQRVLLKIKWDGFMISQ